MPSSPSLVDAGSESSCEGQLPERELCERSRVRKALSEPSCEGTLPESAPASSIEDASSSVDNAVSKLSCEGKVPIKAE